MPSLADLMSASAPRVLNALPNLGGNLKGAAQYAKAAVITEAQNAVNGAVRGAINTAMSSIFGTPSSPNMSVGGLPSFGPPSQTFGGLMGGQTAALVEGNPLAGMNARADAVLNFNWYATLPPIGSLTLPWYYCEEASLSYRNVETQAVYRRGHQQQFPKSYTVPNLRLGFMVDDSNAAMSYLSAWSSKVLSPFDGSLTSQGLWGRPVDYLKNITLSILSVNKSVVLTATYYGCWLASQDALSLVSADNGRLIVQADFNVDDVVFNFQPVGSGGFNSTLFSTVKSISSPIAKAMPQPIRQAGLSAATSILARSINNILRF